MSVRFRGSKPRFPACVLATTVLLALLAPAASGDSSSASPGSLIKIGEGSSPIPGIPAIKIEVPSVTGGGKPLVEVGVEEKGVTVGTPVATVEAKTPSLQTPTTSTPVETTTPVLEKVTEPGSNGGGTSGAGSESGNGGGSSGGSSSSGSSASSNPVAGAASTLGTSASSGDRTSGATPTAKGTAAKRKRTGAAGVGTDGTRGSATATKPADGATSGATDATSTGASGSDPLASLGRSLPLPLPVPDWSKPIILLLALLAIAFATRWWLATRRARRLERRQDVLLRDIEVMQAALVPDVPEALPGLAVSVAYRPAEGPAAGGDFYDVFELAPDRVAVILGDVAGHGHDALRQAALTRYTLRAFLKETGDPRSTLTLAGHALSEPGCAQLATVAIALFDSSRGTLTYALAGHPPPILTGVPIPDTPASCSSPPIGCELPTGLRQRTIGLPAGARACFFSDGLIEARCDTAAKATFGEHPQLLGREVLAELLAGLPDDDEGAAAQELLAAVRAAASATPDDMAACILTSRVRGVRRTIDIEELEVGRHALHSGHLDAYLSTCGLDGEEAARVLAGASVQLDAHDTAVLLVDRGGTEVEVGVRAGGERLSRTAALRRAELGEHSVTTRV